MLSARILEDVTDVNGFTYTTEAVMFSQDSFDLYFQLFDMSKMPSKAGYIPGGLRFIPAVGATTQVIFGNINDAKKITRVASQPFAQDPSIWKVSVLSTDPLVGTVNLTIKLTEGSAISTIHLKAAVLVEEGDVC